MSISSPDTKTLLWLSCREKRCCHATRVVIGGRDLFRIATALQLEPWEFTRYCEAYPGAVDGFRLAPGGPLFQVILAKRSTVGADGAPCLFLWTLSDGHNQCGLGTLRPMACQTYPALLADGLLCVQGDACSCRRWSVGDLDEPGERRLLACQLAEADEYSMVVERWNQLVALEGARSYTNFCRYLMGCYSGAGGGAP